MVSLALEIFTRSKLVRPYVNNLVLSFDLAFFELNPLPTAITFCHF
jgi:hypothetical protein